jgi:hypothetical protein
MLAMFKTSDAKPKPAHGHSHGKVRHLKQKS